MDDDTPLADILRKKRRRRDVPTADDEAEADKDALAAFALVWQDDPAPDDAAAPVPLTSTLIDDSPDTTGEPSEVVRILHLSDTHGMHRSIERRFPLPPADVLIHTGDFSESGKKSEIQDFNAWCASLKSRYPHIIVIYGNHEFHGFLYDKACAETRTAAEWHRPAGRLQKSLLPAVTVLEHESVTVRGLTIFGSAWCAWHRGRAPGDASDAIEGKHRFDEIPQGVDLLLTHGPAWNVFDRLEDSASHWGSSKALRRAIEKARPRAHLFGHVHEQRGHWLRAGGGFTGGVEYEATPGQPWHSFPPPPKTYPCDLISCNAMANHADMEGRPPAIAGPARLIHASRESAGQQWRFSVPPVAAAKGAAAPAGATGKKKRQRAVPVVVDLCDD